MAGGVVWSPARIVGEAVLAVTLAGLAMGIGAWVDTLGARTVLLAGAMALLAPARHALPATVLILSAPLAGGWNVMASVLLVCAAWSAGRRITEPWRVAAAFGAACVLHTVPGLYHDITSGAASVLPVTLGLNVLAFLTLAVVPALVGRYRDQRRLLLDALWQNNQQLKREQAMVAREARLLERNRIAHDMHDSLGHQLALISVHAGALQVDPELTGNQREAVRILRGASVTAMAELRAAVGVLHDEAEYREQQNEQQYQGHQPHQGNQGEISYREYGKHREYEEYREHQGHQRQPVGGGASVPYAPRTTAAIDGLVESSRGAGTAVSLDRSGVRRPLAPAADHEAYRIVQEGLTNAYKHAPGAPIRLALRYEPDSLVVEVTNGPVPGGAPEVPPEISGGQGLKGLRERVGRVGGMVHTGPTEDGGFRIAGMLPYGEESAAGSGAEGRSGNPGGHGAGNGTWGAGPYGATSVVPARDVRGQWRPGAVGDGGTVINGADPQRECTTIMSTRKNVAIGCAVTAVVLVAGVIGLGVWGIGVMTEEVKKADISPSVYEEAKVGDAEADIQARLPEEDSWLTSDLADQGPKLPEGATCRHFTSKDDQGVDELTVFRFCFRDGKLVSKETYKAR
ncbi:two-component sensor histidine kinase [Streptomyces sp. CYG20]|nr:two-component sensor histidine kinase [Streptomyces sp. COG21]MBT3082717.1 two-component sensor histidine kinase [Streptomyces sp. COG20]MBT3087538.1 two-component sensor histidine kinase [Streptomyces sp. CYG21]MBT3097430.1 two-component sensor histidine kinase [Streptomyces sp. CBG30]MBT3104690.1 two-component sensor histidine kinase [Streptomyces sp. COG19]MBT3110988.1 two-component sensor histidine kinase [Streptomyces sp. CYG20]